MAMRAQIAILGLLFTCSTVFAQVQQEKSIWHLSPTTVNVGLFPLKLRSGYIKESEKVPFRGNIIYYEGLGDSMMNHGPLFSKLAEEGFRVIAFDYLGQGGSQGTMNMTTIQNINEFGHQVFETFRKKNCQQCDDMTIVGWSTGGLAAYRDAYLDGGKKIRKVVLIAPGISPNPVVGEGFNTWPPNRISLESLTTADYKIEKYNPHIDPIRPQSPVVVPCFSLNLLSTALLSRFWVISKNIKGLVLLSDPRQDTYVNAEDTLKVLKENADHFSPIFYTGARHEIDNERKKISEKAISDIIDFLNAP